MPTTNINLFSQILGLNDRNSFTKVVKKYDSERHWKGINTWTHLVSMLFCQFSKTGSVREIANGLKSATGNINHLGVSCAPCKSSISYQNQQGRWEVFRDLYFELLESFGNDLIRKRQLKKIIAKYSMLIQQ
jgi:hypothetical protein